MIPRDVIVIGAGGHCKVVIATLIAAGHRVSGIVDDEHDGGGEVLGVPILGRPAEHLPSPELAAVIAIGANAQRRRVADGFPGQAWLSVVHPRAVVHDSVRIEAGSVVFAGAVIQPDAAIGAHAIINTAASVDHDCRIGDFAHIAPGAHLCGRVTVGEGTLLGVGASVLPNRHIGEWATVGGGATVTCDVPARSSVVGTPARSPR